jgi:hypothetical protein
MLFLVSDTISFAITKLRIADKEVPGWIENPSQHVDLLRQMLAFCLLFECPNAYFKILGQNQW